MRYEDVPFDDEADDEEQWECAYPGECLMLSLGHHRSECHTVADMEAYYAEVEGIAPLQSENPSDTLRE